MKTLIVHPEDSTTTFLSQIYALLRNKTVVQGGITKSKLRELIKSHDRVFMFGHGSPYGLLNPYQFPDAGFYIVDESMVSALKYKSNSIFIWCYSNHFVQRHGLEGLNCSMFISETREKEYYGFENIEGDLIDQSNERFVSIVSKYINEPVKFCTKNYCVSMSYLQEPIPSQDLILKDYILLAQQSIKVPIE